MRLEDGYKGFWYFLWKEAWESHTWLYTLIVSLPPRVAPALFIAIFSAFGLCVEGTRVKISRVEGTREIIESLKRFVVIIRVKKMNTML